MRIADEGGERERERKKCDFQAYVIAPKKADDIIGKNPHLLTVLFFPVRRRGVSKDSEASL